MILSEIVKKIFKGASKKQNTMTAEECVEARNLMRDFKNIPFEPDRYIVKVGDAYIGGIIPKDRKNV